MRSILGALIAAAFASATALRGGALGEGDIDGVGFKTQAGAGARAVDLVSVAGEIPGDSPIATCDDELSESDLLDIQSLVISPNPPEKGQNLTITATGTLRQSVEEGAYVLVDVKYGLIRLLRTKLDLCEQTAKIDLPCPIEKGERTIEKVVELPKVIPPGRYVVNAQVFTKDDDRVTCLNARVQFH